jgi:hypothetical protein
MDELDFYRGHSRVTEPGAQRGLLDGLPREFLAMAEVVGGVVVHRDETTWRFGFALPEQRRDEANTRYVEQILHRMGRLDPRPPEERFAGTCRDFAVVLCAMLRSAGVPARTRCGFAGYFIKDFFDDHWVVEAWDDRGWRLIDAQIASAPKGSYANEFDPMDVPRDAFLVAGQAWQDCRTGRRDPHHIGTSAADLTGMWEIQGSVVRDLANLNRVETLPWDNWGLIPIHYDQLESHDIQMLDRVAAISAAGGPLQRAAELYGSDRLTAPTELGG